MTMRVTLGYGSLISVALFEDDSTVFAKPSMSGDRDGFGCYGYIGWGGGCRPRKAEGGDGGTDRIKGGNTLEGPGSLLHISHIPVKIFQLSCF